MAFVILLISIIWLFIGLWICFKRDWYSKGKYEYPEPTFICIFSVIVMPLNLIIVFIIEFCNRKWDNYEKPEPQ